MLPKPQQQKRHYRIKLDHINYNNVLVVEDETARLLSKMKIHDEASTQRLIRKALPAPPPLWFREIHHGNNNNKNKKHSAGTLLVSGGSNKTTMPKKKAGVRSKGKFPLVIVVPLVSVPATHCGLKTTPAAA